ALALEQPEIVDGCYRLANTADGGETHRCATEHPDWHLDHSRAGELVLVGRSGEAFADPYNPRLLALRGDHGGPGQQSIPLAIAGGPGRARAPIGGAHSQTLAAANPALGATAAWLLGVRPSRYVGGKPVPASLSGRILREAFEEAPRE